MARELTIGYGSISMGGASTTYLLDGKYSSTEKATEKTVTWRVVVTGASAAAFASACDSLEDEFRKRNLALTITFGGSTHVASGSEGFLEVPTAAKLTDVATTGRSRSYECSVSFRLPASDESDRVWARTEVSEDDSLMRTIIVTGQWTATSAGGSARSNAETKVPAFATTMRPSGTWDEGILSVTVDDQDKLADCRYEQREIVYNQSAAGLNHASILRPTIAFHRDQPNPGHAPGYGTRARSTITATYSCGVAKAVTTDLALLYKETIRPFLIAEVARLWPPSGQTALMHESPGLVHSQNRIDARLVFEVEVEPAGVFSYKIVQTVDVQTGRVLVPQWEGDDGGADTKVRFQGPRRVIRTTVIEVEGIRDDLTRLATIAVMGQLTWPPIDDDTPTTEADVDDKWILQRHSLMTEPVEYGDVDSGQSMLVYRTTDVIVEEYRTKPSGPTSPAGGPSAGGGGDGEASAPTTSSGGAPADNR